MKKFIVLLALSLPSTAVADDDATLGRLLLAHHEAPTRAELERHVEAPKARLIAIALDARVFPPMRKRAIAALAAWPDTEVEATYRTLLVRRDQHVVHHVVFAVGRAFPRQAPRLLGPLLDERDRGLAISAIDALVRVDTPAARARLDRTPALRDAIDAARRRAAGRP